MQWLLQRALSHALFASFFPSLSGQNILKIRHSQMRGSVSHQSLAAAGGWGLGAGDWGLGAGGWGHGSANGTLAVEA